MENAEERIELAGNTDTALLKVIALVTMIIDHLGVVAFPRVTELRIIGRIAFPLYAWCLVVGCVKTRSAAKYGLRLLCGAVVAQPLYMMALNHAWTDWNIMFSLLIAMIAIQGIRLNRFGSRVWVPLVCYVIISLSNFSYGWKGLTFILLLYAARENRKALAAVFVAFSLFWGANSAQITQLFGHELAILQVPGIGSAVSAFLRLQTLAWLAVPLVVTPMNTKLHFSKWVGYAAYPVHLIVLIALRLANGATLQTITKGF